MTRHLQITLLSTLVLLATVDANHRLMAEEGNGQYRSTMGNPNQIDTVYFTLDTDDSASDSKALILTFWARDCNECRLSGLITASTKLFNAAGEERPLSSLHRNKKYEALAVMFQNASSTNIKSIHLAD